MSSPRLSLGAMLGIAACSSSAGSGPLDGGAVHQDPPPVVDASSDDGSVESGALHYLIPPGDDASNDDGGIVTCSSRGGYFACGTNVCNRAIQACFSGSACVSYRYVAPSCGACPTCDCLSAKTLLDIESCQEDVAGSIAVALYPVGGPGTPCKVDGDCDPGLCMNGTCECQPAGAVATQHGPASDCCSGSGGDATSPDGGNGPFTCWAEKGSKCTTTAFDCYGGPCEGGVCTCIGPGGPCAEAKDCCDGRCVQEPSDRVCR
jgi:hypothetical protein